MFKEYGGETIPKGSINGQQLRKYVSEARERYGLVGNPNISDEEIAQALYKHSKELGGNTAAINEYNSSIFNSTTFAIELAISFLKSNIFFLLAVSLKQPFFVS